MEKTFTCPKCSHAQTDKFDICPSCSVVLSKLNSSAARSTYRKVAKHKAKSVKRQWLFMLSAGVVVFVFFLLGNFHIVRGSTYKGPMLLPKSTFGFSETFINTDAITGVPYVAAASRYPLSIKALQRVGFLETDEDRKARIQRELDRELQQIQIETEREYRQALKESQEEYERILREYKVRY